MRPRTMLGVGLLLLGNLHLGQRNSKVRAF